MKRYSSKDYFHFTRSERNGVLVLLTLILISLFLPDIYDAFRKAPEVDFSLIEEKLEREQSEKKEQKVAEPFDFDINEVAVETLVELGLSERVAKTFVNFRNTIKGFETLEDVQKVYGLKEADYRRLLPYMRLEDKQDAEEKFLKEPSAIAREEKPTKHLFAFNPNTIPLDSLNLLMIPTPIAHTIKNYRSKGGTFETKKDLLKIYGMTGELFENLAPFIQLPEKRAEVPRPTSYNEEIYERKLPPKIDINKATPEEWQQLNGIGPAYARRIVRFRDKLGGFYNIEQVGETYYLPDSTFQKIKPFLIHSPIPKKININNCTEGTLKKHPYLSYRQAGAIIAYRNHHGPFQSLEDLAQIHGLPEEVRTKILPYLEL